MSLLTYSRYCLLWKCIECTVTVLLYPTNYRQCHYPRVFWLASVHSDLPLYCQQSCLREMFRSSAGSPIWSTFHHERFISAQASCDTSVLTSWRTQPQLKTVLSNEILMRSTARYPVRSTFLLWRIPHLSTMIFWYKLRTAITDQFEGHCRKIDSHGASPTWVVVKWMNTKSN